MTPRRTSAAALRGPVDSAERGERTNVTCWQWFGPRPQDCARILGVATTRSVVDCRPQSIGEVVLNHVVKQKDSPLLDDPDHIARSAELCRSAISLRDRAQLIGQKPVSPHQPKDKIAVRYGPLLAGQHDENRKHKPLVGRKWS
jgi:hypothetical protein